MSVNNTDRAQVLGDYIATGFQSHGGVVLQCVQEETSLKKTHHQHPDKVILTSSCRQHHSINLDSSVTFYNLILLSVILTTSVG